MQPLTDEELNSITRAIFTRYGIDFTNYEPTSLKRRIERIISQCKCENSLGLWRKIISEKDFIQFFIDEVTVGLTEMFRNHDFWIKVKEDIFPQISYRRDISIWHAGCSTGEEVYSMAICLTEEGLLRKSSVISTDLNSRFIKSARKGKFSSTYSNTYEKNYIASKGKKSLNSYYELQGEDMVFNKLDMSKFSFEEHNLTKDNMYVNHDIILCRNVMIYFDDKLKMKVLEMFHNALKDGGFFIIGYYDALPENHKKFFRVYDNSSRIYIKAR